MATKEKTLTPAEIARAAVEALSKRDVDLAREFWHEDIVEDFLAAETLRGREAVAAYFAGLFAALPDFKIEIERVVGDDELAFISWHATGTFDGGPFLGIEPTGRPIDLRGVDCMEMKEGKIVKNTIWYDGAGFARQVGLLPARDSAPDKAILAAFNGFTKLRSRLPV